MCNLRHSNSASFSVKEMFSKGKGTLWWRTEVKDALDCATEVPDTNCWPGSV